MTPREKDVESETFMSATGRRGSRSLKRSPGNVSTPLLNLDSLSALMVHCYDAGDRFHFEFETELGPYEKGGTAVSFLRLVVAARKHRGISFRRSYTSVVFSSAQWGRHAESSC